MDNMDTLMNTLIILAGFYLLYSASVMKLKGEVGSSFMSRDIDWAHVPEDNKKSYIKVMMPANIVMGLIMIATGAAFTFGDRLGLNGIVTNVLIGVALLICVAYGVIIMHFQSKYLR